MRFATLTIFAAVSVIPGVFSAPPTTVVDHVSQYDGVKVLRVPTGADTAPLDTLIESFELERWTTGSTANSHIDVQVPQDKYSEFISAVAGISATGNVTRSVITMHEDLGKSIREESPAKQAKILSPLG
jgi:hypothetical protein